MRRKKIDKLEVARLRAMGFGYKRIAGVMGVSTAGVQRVVNNTPSRYKPTRLRDSPEEWARRSLHEPGRGAITTTDILRAIPLDHRCPIFGTPLVFYGQGANSATLDRIDPAAGYTKGNIAVISSRANRLKNNASLEDLLKITLWLAGQQGRLEELATRLRAGGLTLQQIADALRLSVTKAYWLSGGKRK